MDERSPASGSRTSGPNPLGILCDVDGTLYHQLPLQAIMAANVAVCLLLRPRRTLRDIRIIKHLREAQEHLRNEKPAAAAAEAQIDWAARATGIDRQEVLGRYRFWMEQAPLCFLPLCVRKGLVRMLRRWHARGVPLAVYSDYPVGGKLKALGVADLFQAVVCSWDGDVGTFKPAPRGFKVAAEKLGLDPARAVYIGDRERVDGQGARNAGMRAIIVGRTGWRGQLQTLDEDLQPPAAEDDEATRCWICGRRARSLFRPSTIRGRPDSGSVRITDSTYGQSAALHRCGHCGFIFAQPLPHGDMLSLYRRMEDPEYQATASARRGQMRRLLELATASHPAARTLLDVGAATGLLMVEAAARGLAAEGVEPSKWCVDVARDVNGVTIRHGALEDCSDELGRYDLVMLVDVLEHVVDPMSLLRRASQHLADGGRLVVVTPDIGSGLARLMGRRWWHHRVGHVGYFDRRSIRRALGLCGLQVVRDVPVGWRFPAGYVYQRLAQYMPIPIVGPALRKLAGSRWSRRELDLSLRDSRMFIAARAGKQP